MEHYVHIYCGEGKGKTTSAMGLAIRTVGNGLRVVIVQFLKGRETGELAVLRNLPNVSVYRPKQDERFTFQMTEAEKQELFSVQTTCLIKAIDSMQRGECDLLILDEILGAIETKTIDKTVLIDCLQNKPYQAELVLTGRYADEEICIYADYLSRIEAVKHPYEKGVSARKGIEY